MLICPYISTEEFIKQYKFTHNQRAVRKRMCSCLVVFPLPCPVAAAQPNRIPKGELARTENNCSSYPGSLAQCAVHLSTPAREPQSRPTAFSVGRAPCALAQLCSFSLHCSLSLQCCTPAWVRPYLDFLLFLPLSRAGLFLDNNILQLWDLYGPFSGSPAGAFLRVSPPPRPGWVTDTGSQGVHSASRVQGLRQLVFLAHPLCGHEFTSVCTALNLFLGVPRETVPK